MLPLDTTPEAAAIQRAIHQRLGPSGRLRLAIELSDLAWECAKAGMRSRHPQWGEPQILAALVRDLHGISLNLP